MRAQYIEGGLVRVSLKKGEKLATLAGPVSSDIAPVPGLLIWDALLEAGIAIEPLPVAVPAISDRQFAQALALAGTITEAEALAWAARGELPQAMEDALDQIPDTDGQRFGARMMLAAATSYERSHPLTEQLGGLLTNPATGKPYDAAALDALWSRAAAL